MDIIRKIKNKNFKIIFSTSYWKIVISGSTNTSSWPSFLSEEVKNKILAKLCKIENYNNNNLISVDYCSPQQAFDLIEKILNAGGLIDYLETELNNIREKII